MKKSWIKLYDVIFKFRELYSPQESKINDKYDFLIDELNKEREEKLKLITR